MYNPSIDDLLALKRLTNVNIIDKLRNREIYGVNTRQHPYYVSRQFYRNILPNLTVANIEKPPCFIRKFTPDGKYLIAFSVNQTSVEIYTYHGSAAANDLLQFVADGVEYATHNNTAHLAYIRQYIFGKLFSLKHCIPVVTNGQQLNRECSLFVNCFQFMNPLQTSCWDGRRTFNRRRKPVYEHQYMIVGSAQYCPEDNYPHYYDIYSNNESISLSTRSALEDYTLYLIDIEHGRLTDKRTFKVDKIFLSHNQGLYLYRNILAVLSIQHQTIHLFEIDFNADGAIFVEIKKIGRFCYDNDETLIRSAFSQRCPTYGTKYPHDHNTLSARPQPNVSVPPFREASINTLKHRVLVFLYRKALTKHCQDPQGKHLIRFHKNFERLLNMRMWKMQLLDEEHLLIKYTHEEVITLRISDINSLPTLFVIYNIHTTQIVDAFQNQDPRLLNLYEQFCDHFRNVNNTHRVYRDFANLHMYASNNDIEPQLARRDHPVGGLHGYNPILHCNPVNADKHSHADLLGSGVLDGCIKRTSSDQTKSGRVIDNSSLYLDTSFQFVSSQSNNMHSASFYRRSKKTVITSNKRGDRETAKRIHSQIPISAQSFNPSPYLDFSLFGYDEKWISSLERPKQCDDYPIRIYDRATEMLAFRVYPGLPSYAQSLSSVNHRMLAAFTFHPYEPFFITIQRNNQDFIVNLHLRHNNISFDEIAEDN